MQAVGNVKCTASDVRLKLERADSKMEKMDILSQRSWHGCFIQTQRRPTHRNESY